MERVTIHIREVHLNTGVHEHVVVFDADIQLLPDDSTVKVELVSVSPRSWRDEKDEKIALQNIQEGVAAVLGPRGSGALVQVSNLLLHPVDFHPEKFKEYTIRYLEQALASTDDAT